MQKNKVHLLCTMTLAQSLVDQAAANDVLIDALSFIQVKPIKDKKIIEMTIQLSSQPLTAVFTSMNAADAVIEKLKSSQIKPEWKIYCMAGITQKIIAGYFGESAISGTANNADNLSKKIISDGVHDIIFFCGNNRREELPNALSMKNINVKEIIVYETTLTPHVVSKKYNGILFFSPSAATSFFSLNKVAEDVTLFAIGDTTANTIKQYAKNKIVISEYPGKEALIKNCIKYFQTHPVY